MITRQMVGAWHADIDYLRLTMKPGGYDEDTYRIYGAIWRDTVAQITGGDTAAEEWRWQGYTGKTARGVSFGYGPAGAIIQASSTAAAILGDQAVPWDNCTRVDVQLTFWLNEYDGNVARRIADQVNDARGQGAGRRARPRYINGYGEGDTAYIGSRSSNRYIRVYDKERESGDTEGYAAAWRFEVEYKDDLAPAVWEEAPRRGDRSIWAYSVVAAEMARNGVLLPRLAPERRRVKLPGGAAEDRNARALRWLSTQVRPSVERLLAEGYELSYIAELIGLW